MFVLVFLYASCVFSIDSTYYYNNVTAETSWTKPENFVSTGEVVCSEPVKALIVHCDDFLPHIHNITLVSCTGKTGEPARCCRFESDVVVQNDTGQEQSANHAVCLVFVTSPAAAPPRCANPNS